MYYFIQIFKNTFPKFFLVIRCEIGKKFPTSLGSNESACFTIWFILWASSFLLAKKKYCSVCRYSHMRVQDLAEICSPWQLVL